MKRISDEEFYQWLKEHGHHRWGYLRPDFNRQAQLDSCEKELAQEYKKWEEAAMKAEQALEAEHKEKLETMFNPDFLKFKEGVQIGRSLQRTIDRDKIKQAIDAASIAYESTCEALIEEKVREISEALEGLMEIAEMAMPDTYFESDSRVNKARQALKKEVNDES